MSTPRLAVIGAGMAGVLSAIKLAEAGYDDVVVYEKADRLGGTWRENTYPGVACDIPSHLYRYSFAPNPDWTHTFSPGAEIEAYLEAVADDYGVTGRIRFGQEVTGLRWDGRRWRLATAAGERDAADAVVAATGVLHRPRLPDLEGLDTFAGAAFHSARWDHDVDLAGKRLGVVGAGSTAVQIVSATVDAVAQVTMFQRTPQWVLQGDNPPYPPEVRREFRRHPEQMQDLYDQLSTSFTVNFANAVVDATSPALAAIEQLCQANLDTVADPELRAKLQPDYRAACKRLILSPDFYQAVQRPNAEVVTEKIVGVEPAGVRTADGRLHELDVLVLATGFQVDAFLRPMTVVGVGGRTLDQAWDPRPVAYHSISVPGFPNLFLLNGPNGPVGNFSLIEVAELQVGYVLQLLEEVRSGRCPAICATAAATEAFEAARTEATAATVWTTGCRSWYLDDRGVPAVWPWTFDRFREEMAAPVLDDYEVASG